ncbi:MAG: DUF1987 domain-containing protein [Bacteroidota bacterium]
MDDLIIVQEADNFYTPNVSFNAGTGVLEIEGESYLEDTKEFYDPLLEWVRNYTESIDIPVEFNIKLTYYNTSSSRSLLELLYILKNFKERGGDLKVNWYFDPDNIDIEEEVEDFEIDTGLKINMIEIEEDDY